ncbi:F-box domain-containing protein [Caenorhabditis elegans]|uniref:F-box domain-containing protein n=1 Tax=Caenorhabditis elegans TaxID=6239 RepID=O17299_CAEEL|nr:F-box domain-containing protein [Caenorhabditis elegans]CCD71600.1 F-box domain-containing protein [Caenorhabditis elegans]|eukprot:NP_001022518.1 Uncharacterized protein CELE_ZK250.13 [Caenorhabditis elegans]
MPYAFEMLSVLNYSAIRKLSIFVRFETRFHSVNLDLSFGNHSNSIYYMLSKNDTLIDKTKYNKRLVGDKNYIDVVCEDLLHILTNAKFGEDIEIRIWYDHDNQETLELANRLYEQFKIHSQTTKNPIYVRSLHLQIENLSQLCSVLTYFNPDKLTELTIAYLGKPFGFKNIVVMDHWKNAKKIQLDCIVVEIPIENFSHCEDVTIFVLCISADDIRTLVNAIVSNSSCLKHFCFTYHCLHENITEQFLDNLICEKQINTDGEHVRLIENEIKFIHNLGSEKMYISKLFDKNKDESIETSALTSRPSKSAMLCLSNQLIMEKIVQHFDFADLAVLRKVSRGSRQCVDILKPDPKLVAMNFHLKPSIFVEVFGRDNYKRFSCEAPGDLLQILKDQKTALKRICVTLGSSRLIESGEWNSDDTKIEDWKLREEQFVEMFSKSIFLRGDLIPVVELCLRTLSLKVAAQMLQNVDPVAIKTIEIRPPLGIPIALQLESHLEQLVCLEQWTSARELKIEHFFVDCDIENLIHFSKVDIRITSISLKDVLYLKKKFLLSSNFLQFKAKFSKTNVDDSIFEDNFLGEPFRRVEDISSNQPDIWFFSYKEGVEDLQIRYYPNAKEFMFKRVPRR